MDALIPIHLLCILLIAFAVISLSFNTPHDGTIQ